MGDCTVAAAVVVSVLQNKCMGLNTHVSTSMHNHVMHVRNCSRCHESCCVSLLLPCTLCCCHGLCLVLQDGATFFCATPLAASLCGGTAAAATAPDGADGSGAGSKEGSLHTNAYIIVETNFRVSGGELGEGDSSAWHQTGVGSLHALMQRTRCHSEPKRLSVAHPLGACLPGIVNLLAHRLVLRTSARQVCMVKAVCWALPCVLWCCAGVCAHLQPAAA
jgi:hypothetical protein